MIDEIGCGENGRKSLCRLSAAPSAGLLPVVEERDNSYGILGECIDDRVRLARQDKASNIFASA
jgi:hypothetical protein